MMNLFDFAEQRKQTKRKLGEIETAVREAFKKPELREIKNTNNLIRYVWHRYKDYSAESITRIARKLRASEEYDTKDNQKVRANLETAYHEKFKD